MSAKPLLNYILAVLLLAIVLQSCKQRPLIAKDCSHALEAKNTLVAFVGEKIRFEELPHQEGAMDGGFKATYRILQRVYGEYGPDTIDFVAYDHYGVPAFSRYQHVLLYLSKDDEGYYHEKYQFSPVYLTTGGRWAGTYSSDYQHAYNTATSVKPEIIPFAKKVAFPTSLFFFNDMIHCAEQSFPKPYFRIEGDSAVAVYGNYVEELFQLKKTGILTARGLFGDTAMVMSPVVADEVILEPIVEPIKLKHKFSATFFAFANKFIASLANGDSVFISSHIFDSICKCRLMTSAKRFMAEKKERIWDKRFMTEVIPTGLKELQSVEADASSLSHEAIIGSNKENQKVFRLHLRNDRSGLIDYSIDFDFIETKSGFRLCSYTDYTDRQCTEEEYSPYNYFTSVR